MRYFLAVFISVFYLQGCAYDGQNVESESVEVQSKAEVSYYSEADFLSVRKIDAHVHANVANDVFLEVARENNFEILSINVDYPDFPEIDIQADIARKLHAEDSAYFHFATTFSMDGFGREAWSDTVINRVNGAVKQGALAVKVWKNIGMVEQDIDGSKIFLNDGRFSKVIKHLEQNQIPLIAHQGEPRNAWLPLEEMTTNNDRLYFSSHPEYYPYLHPEEPRYEKLMAVRDEFVGEHVKLSVVGAHLASLEWSVDEIAKFLDFHPNATVDMAARMSEIQNQSHKDYDHVREFFIKYQDRILYGSDLTHNPQTPEMREQNPPATDNFPLQAAMVWRSDWRYMTTEKEQFVPALQVGVKGLKLPSHVIDKVFYANAQRVFGIE